MFQPGDYVICKYGGGSGEVVVGRVKRLDGDDALLENLLTGGEALRKVRVLEKRNAVVTEAQAQSIIAVYQKTGSRMVARIAAVNLAVEIGARKPAAARAAAHASPNARAARRDEEDAPFWGQVRLALRAHVNRTIGHLAVIAQDAVRDEFEGELRIAIEAMKTKLRVVHMRHGTFTRIGFAQVVEACRVLRLPAPNPGQLPSLQLAKKHKALRVHEHHPDKNGGAGSAALLQEALDAFKVIEAYCTQQHNVRQQTINTLR